MGGCSSKSTNYTPKTFHLEINDDAIFEWPPYKIVQITPLETSETSVLRRVSKLREHKGKYVLQSINENLLVFEMDGSFLFPVGKKGKGPSEYLQVSDFCLNPAGDKINVLDFQNYHLYNVNDGSFIETIPLDWPEGYNPTTFVQLTDHQFYYWNGSPDSRDLSKEYFMLLGLNQGKITYHFPYNGIGISADRFQLLENDVAVMSPPTGDYIAYTLDAAGVHERYRFEFSGKLKSTGYENFNDYYRKDDGIGSPSDVWELEDYVFINFPKGKYGWSALIDKSSGKIISCGRSSLQIKHIQDGHFYVVIDFPVLSYYQQQGKKHPLLADFDLQDLTAENNPIIVKFRFKE